MMPRQRPRASITRAGRRYPRGDDGPPAGDRGVSATAPASISTSNGASSTDAS